MREGTSEPGKPSGPLPALRLRAIIDRAAGWVASLGQWPISR